MDQRRPRDTLLRMDPLRPLPDVRAIGGMGKMLQAFIDEVHPDDVMSYADTEWTDGDVYRRLGFREESRRKIEGRSDCIKFRLKLTDYA